MSKAVLHFSHASGFPAKTYRKLFSYLQDEFEIGFINTLGHNPDYPLMDNWVSLIQELDSYIQIQYSEPVIGVGHSLGGVLTAILALRKPELFRAIVLLDPPLLPARVALGLRLAKWFGFVDKVTPAGRTKGRKEHWRDEAEAIEYFSEKKLFRHFDPDCVTDYVKYGLKATAQGLQLVFNPDIEVNIYRTTPHIYSRIGRRFKLPATVIFGAQSNLLTNQGIEQYLKKLGTNLITIPGTHMFPFEHPATTAATIKEVLAKR